MNRNLSEPSSPTPAESLTIDLSRKLIPLGTDCNNTLELESYWCQKDTYQKCRLEQKGKLNQRTNRGEFNEILKIVTQAENTTAN